MQKFENEWDLLKISCLDNTNYLLEKVNFIRLYRKKCTTERSQNELLALFREEITRDINDVNKTWTKKVRSTSEGHFRDIEVYLQKRRTSNEINTTELPDPMPNNTDNTNNSKNLESNVHLPCKEKIQPMALNLSKFQFHMSDFHVKDQNSACQQKEAIQI